ncbi:MAG: hypothetical protein EOP80_21825 [Variovorax sp.]|nr:MAG: hypothetical protein EOP80_21825 [Variovorax sp.]
MTRHEDDKSTGCTPLVNVKFRGAVLVCGDCQHRGSGPKKLRARDVRKLLKHDLGSARFKLRVVESSCLGLCPKKAMALVALAGKAPALAAEARSADDVAAFAAATVAICKDGTS